MTSCFDASARQWDSDYRVGRARIISAEIARLLLLGKADRAMDFGAGTGLVGLALAEGLASLTCVEASSEMAGVLRAKIDAANAAARIAVLGSVFDRSLEAGSYDAVFSSMALHHNRNLGELVRRFHELLKPSGRLCIVDLMPDDGSFHASEEGFDGYDGFDPDWLAGELGRCGFGFLSKNVFFRDTKRSGEKAIDYSLFSLLMGKRCA